MGVRIVKSYFAFLPVTIGCETRWLERVYIVGFYEEHPIFNTAYFNPCEFLKSKDDIGQNAYKKEL